MGYLNNLLTSATVAVALYGCNNNNDSPAQSGNTPETPVTVEHQKYNHQKYNPTKLERKLMTILQNIKGRFESSEMKREEQFDFYCNQLKQQEMIDTKAKCNNTFEMSKIDEDKVLEVLVGSKTKLKITDATGLNHDYLVIPETSLSDGAKQDLKAYNKFSSELKDYLVEIYGESNPVLKEDLMNKVREYITSSHFDVSDSRKKVIAIYGYVDNRKNFNVLSEAEVAEQEIETIRNILDNIKLE